MYHLKQCILLVGDIASFTLGFLAAFSVRNAHVPTIFDIQKHTVLFLIVFVLWVVVNYINGLYDLHLHSDKKYVRRFIETTGVALLVGIIFFYIVPDRRITPKTILALNVVFGYGISFMWRLLYNRLIGTTKLQINVLLLGNGAEMKELISIMNTHPERGYRVRAIIDPTRAIKPADYPGLDIYQNLSALRPAITTHKIQMVVVAADMQTNSEVLIELYQLLFWNVQMIDITSFYEMITGRIPPSSFSESWFLQNLADREKPMYDKIRRLTDYIVALVLFVVFAALFIPVAIIIRITSKGAAVYTQKRVGQYGNLFTIYKFRTMYALASDGSAEPDGARFATKDDERVTPFGKFLRKTRLDELPQVINLIKGELTLIGPRPERPEIVQKLEEKMPYYSLRHIVKPGITGWAAINQHYTDSYETSLQKLQYDLYYIKNRSLLLDLSIILRTVNVVIRLMGQ